MFGSFFRWTRRSANKARQPLRTRLTLEGLEERVVPNASVININTLGGAVVINDVDNVGADTITLTETAAGTYKFGTTNGNAVGADTIILNGVAQAAGSLPITLNSVSAFNITMGSNGDGVTVTGDATGDPLQGNFILGGSGNLTLQDAATAFDISGQLQINHTTPGLALTVNLLQGKANYGNILINNGSGGATINITGSAAGTTTVNGFLTLNLAGGGNNSTVGAAAGAVVVTGPLLYVGGVNNDNLTLNNTTVESTLTANMGSGAGNLTIDNGSVIQGTLGTSFSGNNVTYTIQGGSDIQGLASLNSNGKANTTVNVQGTINGKNTTLDSSLSVITGTGTTTINILGNSGGLVSSSSVTITGDVDLKVGATGKLTMNIQNANTTITGNLFQTDTALSNENVSIGGNSGVGINGSGGTIGGFVSLNSSGATGNVNLTVDGSGVALGSDQIGSFLSVIGGKGGSILLQNGASTGDNFGYGLGTGATNVVIAGTNTVVNGNVFQVDGLDGVPAAGGLVGVTTDNFGLLQGAVVTGYVSVNAAKAIGSVQVVIDGTGLLNAANQIGYYLSVISGTGADLVDLYSTSIADNFGFDLGAGNDSIQTDGNVTIGGMFFGLFGTGNDQLLVCTALGVVNLGVGPAFGPVGLFGSTTVVGSMNVANTQPNEDIPNEINMGSGNDSVQLGANATSLFIYDFDLAAQIAAGAGISTLNIHLVNGVATSVSFPNIPDGNGLQTFGFTNII